MDGRKAPPWRGGAPSLTLPEATLRAWEFLSYLVTVLGLPIALFAVWREMRAERENEKAELEAREDEIYVSLSREYSAFLETMLGRADPGVFSDIPDLRDEQRQQRDIYFEMLVSLFERAFILLHEPEPSANAQRRWGSWENYIGWWLTRPAFRAYAAANIGDEDPDFVAFMRGKLAVTS